MQQLKLQFNQHTAPIEYDYANLYENLIQDKESKIYIGSGYNGSKTLSFYNDKNTGEMWSRIENADIEFINFEEAYQFILNNNINVYNISQGSWQKEIQEYERRNNDYQQSNCKLSKSR